MEGAGADAVRPRPHRPHQPGARPGPTGATARPGRRPGRPTCRRRRWSGGSAPRPTPSCTATPPSASSTGPATPRSWPRRRSASGWRRWPSPTTTASTAWCASPRRPGPSACPPCSAPSCRSGSPSRRTACPTRRAATCSCWPATRRATPGWRPPSAPPSWPGPRRASRSTTASRGRRCTATTGSCSPAAARAPCPPALERHGPAAAARELDALIATFGRHNVVVELCDHGDPLDSHRNDALAQLAVRAGVDVVATTNAHYATPARRPLATAMAAVRARRSLDELDRWLPACAGAHLRSGDEQARRFARWPGAVERAAELGRACAFDLQLVAPQLPPFPCPDGLSEMGYLRRLTAEGAARYGSSCADAASCAPPAEPSRVSPGPRRGYRRDAQIEHELALIEQLGFPGYFLVVWDIVDFCRRSNIYCQGRGSAANSAVCYALGITNADAVKLGLLFERFLSPGARRAARHRHRHRVGPPGGGDPVRLRQARPPPRRPGRQRHHLPRQVVDPRRRQGARLRAGPAGRLVEAGRRLGRRRRHRPAAGAGAGRSPPTCSRWPPSSSTRPRHLGIHSGGMVICDRPIVEVCPVEWARLTGATSKSKTLTRHRADPHGAPVGQGRLRRHRAGEVRPARPRDARGAARVHRPRAGGARRRRRRPGHDPAGGRGVRHALPGRLGGRVPGGEPGPDGHAAPAAAPRVLRPRGGGGPHPPRSDPGRLGAPLHPAPQRPGGASPTSTRCWSRR